MELHKPYDLNTQVIYNAVVLVDEDGRIIQIDAACESLFDYSKDELLNQNVEILVSTDHRQNFIKQVGRLRNSRSADRISTVAMTKNREEFFAEFSVDWVESNHQVLCVLTIHDMSLKKLLVSAQLSQDAMTRAIIDASLDSIVSIDSEGNFIEFNRAAERTFGYSREEVIGKPMAEYILPESFRDAHYAGMSRYLATYEAKVLNQRLELTARRADGSEFPIEITIVPIKRENDELIFSAYLRDITNTRKTRIRWERMLRFEEVNREIIRLFLQLDNVDAVVNEVLAMTGLLLDVSRAYVFRLRENERIIDNTHEWCAAGVKPEIENLKGLPFDELLPSFFPLIAQHDLIAPYHISELPDDIRAILEPQDIQSVLWIPMYLKGRIEGFVGYDEVRGPREWLPEEITMARIIMESYSRALERGQTEKVLVKARDEALRTAKVRSQFVANMSHEIRTPMTGILGMLELLQETELHDVQNEFVSEALNSASRLLNIINEILDFSKLDAGQIILESSQIDVKAIATEVQMTLQPQLKNKPVDLQLDMDPAIPHRVYGDATRLRQVLMNLAGNAIKFTRDGHVTIRIQMTKRSNMARLKFSVQDTGIGIAEDKITQIFDSFVQADGTTTRKYGGTGLGLSISKQLVELMGGSITVDSQLGQGSTFSFTLKLPIAQEHSLQNTDVDRFSDLHVAIVDNDRTARYVLAQHLENWGIQVTHVESQEVLNSLLISGGTRFDIAFLRSRSKASAQFGYDKAQQIIYVLDEKEQPSSNMTTYLHRPYDSSVLFNLLSQLTESSSKYSYDTRSDIPHVKINARILVADDYVDNLDIIDGALSAVVQHIDYVHNGQEVLNQLEKSEYDMVLMDIQMPVMDGLEATQRIRESNQPYRNIPIVAITASVMQHEQEHYREAGINKVVGKPFSIRQLRSTVLELLSKR